MKFIILKSNREILEHSQELISRPISTNKIENSRAYKRMEMDQIEEEKINEENNE